MIKQWSESTLKTAIESLTKDNAIVFPTETVYALACSAVSNKAIEKLYKIKQRSTDHVFSIIVSSIEHMEKYVNVDARVRKLAKLFSPGPLTYVLYAHKNTMLERDEDECLSTRLIKDGKVGVRIPDGEIAQAILKSYDYPLVATSVNLTGEPSPIKVEDISQKIASQVDLTIDDGPCTLGISSTVIDLSQPNKIACLREGTISMELIQRSL